MRKIPVGETISAAYGFAFAGFLSVLGTVWLPYVILLAINFGLVMLFAPDLPGHLMRGEFDGSMLFQLQNINNVAWIPGLIVDAMITVGLQQRALGQIQGPAFFYFSLRMPVWLLVGARILLFVVLIFIAILLTLVTVAFCFATIHFIPRFGIALAVIAGIAAVCWYIYAVVRLAFFLPAVVVAENQIGLGRSWELGQGNFWRMFAVMFATIVPVVIAFYIVLGVVMGPVLMGLQLPHFHPNMTPGDAREFSVAFAKAIAHRFGPVLPFLVVFVFLWSTIIQGLVNGAIGKAYVAVTHEGGM